MPETWRRGHILIKILLQLCRQFNLDTFRVGKAQEEIIARAMTARSPQQRYPMTAQVISPCQQRRAIRQSESDVVNVLVALHQYQRMMIAIATQPDAFAQ